MKKLRFSTQIDAPPAKVWDTMLADASYRDWTNAFCEGSYFEGSWNAGERMRFLSPGGMGMVARIAENRRPAFLSIEHLGEIANGVEDTTSERVRAWAPAYENYRFTPSGGGTRLDVECDTNEEYETYMSEAWPKGLARLKALCESR